MSDFIDLNNDSMCALSFHSSGPIDAALDTGSIQGSLVVVPKVLHAAITVKDHPVCRPALGAVRDESTVRCAVAPDSNRASVVNTDPSPSPGNATDL